MELYQGAVAPEVYEMDLVPGDSGIDLSTISAASIIVRKPDGTIVTWTASLTNQSATTLTLTHAFAASPTDLDQSGDYVLYAKLTLPGGYVTSERVRRHVYALFEVA